MRGEPLLATGVRWLRGPAPWLVLPLLAAALWLWSGRPMFSSAQRVVEVRVEDAFGDPASESRLVRGPVLGYYIGLLDAVAGAAVVWVLIAAGMWLFARRRRAADGAPSTVVGEKE